MADYAATVRWSRMGAKFTDNRYSRAHQWEFDGGVCVPASSSPHNVPAPLSDPANVDPEEAFVASLSSCHMLWFLSIAAKHGYVVQDYVDQAEGVMEPDESGRLAMTRITLRPTIRYAGDKLDATKTQELHHEAHDKCFLANSVKTQITVAETAAVRSDGGRE